MKDKTKKKDKDKKRKKDDQPPKPETPEEQQAREKKEKEDQLKKDCKKAYTILCNSRVLCRQSEGYRGRQLKDQMGLGFGGCQPGDIVSFSGSCQFNIKCNANRSFD